MQDEFKNLLKKNGLKVTSQRIAILEVLKNRPEEHLTAEEIYGDVKQHYPEIGLATVYRTIQVLSDLNLIDKLHLDEGCVRYEISKNAREVHHHHHLICVECGNVLAFRDDLLENLEKRIEETMGFKVSNHEVKLYGLCAICRKQQN